MAYLLPVLLTLSALALGLLYLLGVFRRRRPDEPPLDRGSLPWLGHVLAFRRNTMEFLSRMQGRHGDVFTAQIAGYYFTFVMDPHSFGAVVKESRSKLDFEKFAMQLVARVFNYQGVEGDHKMLQALSAKHLMGDGLIHMTEAMMENLQKLMLYEVGQGKSSGQWRQAGLFRHSYNLVFRAGYLSLFGVQPAGQVGGLEAANEADRAFSEELFVEFKKYDQLFPRLAYAVLPPKKRLEAERLKKFFCQMLSTQKIAAKEKVSPWIADRQQQMVEQGIEEPMQDTYMFLLLWASQGNAGPSAFWLLLFLLKNPEAMKAVRTEVDTLLRETGQKAQAGSPLVNLTRDMLLRTPVLDSAVDESLRLSAAPVLIRSVLEDMALKMADGREYALRKGDRLALFPYLSAQIDPEIHPDPHSFKYDRFLNPDGTRKTDFYKGGRKLKYYNMPWGSGVSMCPGRFFAVNELKQYVFLVISYFDIELLDPEEDIPEIDSERWGFGSMQPKTEVQFRYRLRF